MTKWHPSLSAREITRLYRSGKLSPVEVAEGCLRQVMKYNPLLNAVCYMDEKTTLRQAEESARRWKRGAPKGPLDGVPVTVKDWFDIRGWPTRYGARMSRDAPQKEDSIVVARLRSAGAVFIGKTTLPEFGHKGVTDSLLHGITRNPWNPEKTPGGSSGGAAVAAATGMAPLNIGSDAGGSIRIPASFTGVFGFKPSPGLVPSCPPSVFASLSSIGPLTRCAEDAALMLDVMAGPDARDWNALPWNDSLGPPPDFSGALKKKPRRLKIALAMSINGQKAQPDVHAVFAEKNRVLEALGDVEEIALDCPPVNDVFIRHWMALASSIRGSMPEKIGALLEPGFIAWAERGDRLHLHDYIDAERERMVVGAYFKGLLDRFDILATPSVPLTAFDAGLERPRDGKGRPWKDFWSPFSFPANLARLPAASLPLGLSKTGMPVGIQLMAGYLKDAPLMQAAGRLEKEIGFRDWICRASSSAKAASGGKGR